MISKAKWGSNVKMYYKQSGLQQILPLLSITQKKWIYKAERVWNFCIVTV